MHLRSVASVLTILAVFTVAGEARATEVAPKASLPELVGEGHRWLVAVMTGTTPASAPSARSVTPTAERAVVVSPPALAPMFDLSPHASLVARDWRGSMKIAGARRTLILDDIRPTASSRMLIGRISNDARLTTFVQVGVGEWRIDTVMFPYARSYAELAGQMGIGFDVQLAHDVRLAGEAQYTLLFRDLQYTSDEIAPRILAAVVALQATF
jgi:hypothetical protein